MKLINALEYRENFWHFPKNPWHLWNKGIKVSWLVTKKHGSMVSLQKYFCHFYIMQFLWDILSVLNIEYPIIIDGVTPLMMACNSPSYTVPFNKSLEVVKLLVNNGANVKATNRKRMDALMHAACNGWTECVKYYPNEVN